MKAKIQQLIEKIDALSLRERALVFGAVLVLLFTLWNELLMIPLEKQHARTNSSIEAVNKRLPVLEEQIESIKDGSAIDPNKDNQAKLEQFTGELSKIDQQISDLAANLIPPQKMAQALEQMLSFDTGLKIVRVENLGVEPLLKSDVYTKGGKQEVGGNIKPALGIYRHSLLIEFEGEFHQILEYLRALEALPWELFWDRMDYTVKEHPTARVVIGISTLSLQKGWIGV